MRPIYQAFFVAFAFSIPVATLLVAGSHLWLLIKSVRAGNYKYLLISVAAIVGIGIVFAGVGVVWFGYAVAHSKKDIWTDLVVVLATGLPFYGAAYGLWRLATSLMGKLRYDVT